MGAGSGCRASCRVLHVLSWILFDREASCVYFNDIVFSQVRRCLLGKGPGGLFYFINYIFVFVPCTVCSAFLGRPLFLFCTGCPPGPPSRVAWSRKLARSKTLTPRLPGLMRMVGIGERPRVTQFRNVFSSTPSSCAAWPSVRIVEEYFSVRMSLCVVMII